MVKEGAKSYQYGWLDKVMNITENGKVTNSYSYSMDGQIASSSEVGTDLRAVRTNYLWDGLALLKRGTTEYVNEPAVTGGNPILANGKGLFNDMLGNSLGVAEKDKFTAIKRDAFGQTLANSAGTEYNLFTGKPRIGGLGYAFLFRNYRPNLGKWQTQDPLGYPDGWNDLVYVNNHVISSIDWQGASEIENIYDLWNGFFFGKFLLTFNDSYDNPQHTNPSFTIYGPSSVTLGLVVQFGGYSFGIGAVLSISNLTKSLVSTSITTGTLNGKPTKFLKSVYCLEYTIIGTQVSGGTTITRQETFRRNVTITSMVQE
jgi:RHS repeat-associated protein